MLLQDISIVCYKTIKNNIWNFLLLDKTECVDKGDSGDCFLGSYLGQCTENPSYYLRLCSDSCRDFIQVCKDKTTTESGKKQ